MRSSACTAVIVALTVEHGPSQLALGAMTPTPRAVAEPQQHD
jgi:hypothetical protein